MIDERLNLPSASGMDRLANCPGSRALEACIKSAPAQSDAEKKVKVDGTKIHFALEKADFDALEMNQREIAEAINVLEHDQVDAWKKDRGIPLREHVEIIRETRFWMIDEKINNVLSAKPDVVYVSRKFKAALIINYKTGFKPHTAAKLSYQCRTEAVCVAGELELQSVRVAVAQHRFKSCVTAAQYSASDLKFADLELRMIDWRSKQQDAPTCAGVWCDWCKAKGICKTAAVFALLPSTATTPALPDITNDDAAFIERRRTLSKKIFDAVNDRMKNLPEDELQRLNFEVYTPKDRKVLVNPIALIKVLREAKFIETPQQEEKFIEELMPDLSYNAVDEWVGKSLATSIGKKNRNDAIKKVSENLLNPFVKLVPQSKRLSDKQEK